MSIHSQRERVFAELLGDILEGILKPGDPISERQYSKRANVSRVPVREALIQLESKGLVTYRKAQGAFVRAFGVEDIRDLYEVREQLEGAAARLAAGKIDPVKLDAIEEKLRSIKEAKTQEQRDAIRQINTELHDLIMHSSGNALLQRMLGEVREMINISRVWRFQAASEAGILERQREHLRVLDAIRKGDGETAEREMRSHISSWRRLEF